MINREKLEKAFASRGFSVVFSDTKEDALSYLVDYIGTRRAAFGGSVTLEELGLYDALKERPIWHWRDSGGDPRRMGLNSDVYVLSANGVSEDGCIINIDGSGNRVASSLFGPKEVIYVIGRNKVEETYEKALWRARNIAAVKNAIRLNRNTPCVKNGRCMDCESEERICRGFVTITHPMNSQRVLLLFVDEDLGY